MCILLFSVWYMMDVVPIIAIGHTALVSCTFSSVPSVFIDIEGVSDNG